MDTTELSHRLLTVSDRIARACERARRDPTEVRLTAVSKRKSSEVIRAAYELGLRDFGENYAQELEQKADELTPLEALRWHMIGHLQRNKAKVVAKVVSVIHTLDSPRLVAQLEQRLSVENRTIDAFIAVNIGAEPQKSGCSERELDELVRVVRAASHLQLLGLMTIPPEGPPETTRGYFRKLRELAAVHELSRLSMGMSHDFEVAIEEGATDVRIGTALFGARD